MRKTNNEKTRYTETQISKILKEGESLWIMRDKPMAQASEWPVAQLALMIPFIDISPTPIGMMK